MDRVSEEVPICESLADVDGLEIRFLIDSCRCSGQSFVLEANVILKRWCEVRHWPRACIRKQSFAYASYPGYTMMHDGRGSFPLVVWIVHDG
jgi:hypothetical protein